MKFTSIGVLAVSGMAVVLSAHADTLVLRNGSHLVGKFISGQNGAIFFMVDGSASRRFALNDVARVEFNGVGDNADRFNDNFGDDQHSKYDAYRNRPDYRTNQTGAIDLKSQDMARAGIGLGVATAPEQASADGQGRFRVYQNSTLYWSPRTGAHEVHGAIREQYIRMGAEGGRLGYPVSDETAAPDGVGRMNTFEHGSIYWSAKTGARTDYTR